MALDWATEFVHGGVTAGFALVASFFGTKWAESRKLQARFEKLDQISEEMRELTRVQELIKRQMQGGEWNRQTLWKQRLESYTQLMKVSTDYLDTCHRVRSAVLSGTPETGDSQPDGRELGRLRAETFKALTIVEMFCDGEILHSLSRFLQRVGQSTTTAGESVRLEAISEEIAALMEFQASFVAAARKQLKTPIEEF